MELQDYQKAIDRADTTRAIWDALREFFHGTEVVRTSYLHLPPLGAPDDRKADLFFEGFPEESAERYLTERLYRDNPVLSHAQRQVEPVYWDDVSSFELTPQEFAFVQAALLLGLRYGVGIPVYGPDGRRGQCGLGFQDGVQRLEPQVLRDFRLACQLAHLRYCALILPTLGPLPALSRREAEVLTWVARGKSNGLIGDILGISGSTVDAHLRRIYLKLGVFDRISAAIRGIGIGLIHAET